MNRFLLLFLFYFPFLTSCNLSIVNVNAPAVNCVFDPTCKILVSDSTATIPLATDGTNFLQSRTFVGKPGSPANGLYGYEYRVDLRNAIGITDIPCVSNMTIDFGSVVSTLDYDGDGNADQVYVITGGGLGSVGLSSAEQNGNEITFSFDPSVCAGGSPGSGQSSFFFGLTSTQPPNSVTAKVMEVTGLEYSVQARAPQTAGP